MFVCAPTDLKSKLALGLLSIATFYVSTSTKLHAEEQSERKALIDHYVSESKKNETFFASTPVTHVVPSFNTISYALSAVSYDTVISPEENPWVRKSDASKLDLSGYGLSPYLSISLKRIGLGFSVESGNRQAEFTSANSSQYNENRLAALTYRGVGAFIYWIPFGKLWNKVNTTLILGGRNYTAKHEHTRTSFTSGFETNRYTTSINYSVPSYEGGLNFNVSLLKSFSMIPWGNYASVDTTNAMSQIRSDNYERDYIASDVDLFWKDKPDLTYGLDFAAKLGPFQVRLGGLLGLLAAPAGSSQIDDQSLSLAISFEQKGH